MDERSMIESPSKMDTPSLVERVSGLESALLEASELLAQNASAISLVGARLARAEQHVGLPSTDV